MSQVSSASNSIVFSSASKVFQQGRTVIGPLDFTVPSASIVALSGRSGAGKSTAIALAALLTAPDSGAVRLLEVASSDGGTRARATRRQSVGLIFQEINLVPHLSVWNNLTHIDRYESVDRINELLEYLGVAEFGSKLPGELSRGERQRVGIARALAKNPRVVIADEPTASLDAESSRAISDLMRLEADRGAAILIASHDRTLLDGADSVVEVTRSAA